MTPTQQAAVYLLESGDFLVHAESQTDAGVWIAQPPEITVQAGSEMASLGRAIADALSRSATNVPHPTKWTGRWVLNKYTTREWDSKVARARLVAVSQEGGVISVTAMRNLGGTKGFVEEQQSFHEIESATPAELGITVAERLGMTVRAPPYR